MNNNHRLNILQNMYCANINCNYFILIDDVELLHTYLCMYVGITYT